MRIDSVEIKNFRLLYDVALALEGQATVIVGRNNSGKTSLSEVMRRFLSDSTPSFQLEDFSTSCYDCFSQALAARNEGQADDAVRALLPAIELRILIRYSIDQPDFASIAPFIVDLDPTCDRALVVVRYELKDGAIGAFFEETTPEQLTGETQLGFFRLLRERVTRDYTASFRAEDPNDATNFRSLPPGSLRSLVKTGFVNAQRGLTTSPRERATY